MSRLLLTTALALSASLAPHAWSQEPLNLSIDWLLEHPDLAFAARDWCRDHPNKDFSKTHAGDPSCLKVSTAVMTIHQRQWLKDNQAQLQKLQQPTLP